MGAATVLGAPVIRLRAFVAAALLCIGCTAHAEMYYLIVSGVGGSPVYDESFADTTAELVAAAERTLGGDARITVLGGADATLDGLRQAMGSLREKLLPNDRLAVFLVGHGSYDGTDYKFNLKGPDIDAVEFGELLDSLQSQNLLIVNATSASGPVLDLWAAEGRTIIAATRPSGRERNATRFAEQWATALSASEADLDKNESISAQEAFDYAARLVEESFDEEGILATEHPELNGEMAAAFEVSRLDVRQQAPAAVNALYDRLDELTEQVAALRLRREELGPDYQSQMLDLQVEIALVQQQIDAALAGQ
jgi:hypothetical protein